MSVNPYAVHAAGIAAVQTEQGAACPSFTWQGFTVLIQPGSAIRRKDLGTGGFSLNADLRLTVLVASFGNGYTTADGIQTDILQTEIDYLGESYKVESVMIVSGALQLHIEANALNQNS
jgi:hypothetical protein